MSQFPKEAPIVWTKWKFASGTPFGSAFTYRFIHLALTGRHIEAQGVEAQLQALG
ncbi:MAG: hypothetical protein WD824_00100 [Cyclobacteriaceae bacterium]